MPHSPHQTSQIKEIIVKTLSTKEAASGLKDRNIYKILAELQKHGKLKVMVTYDIVKKALEELFKSMLHNLMTGKVRVKDLEVENEKEL